MGIIDWLFGNENKRKYIDQDIRLKIAARDGARCRICKATENLEIDHIEPVSKSKGFGDNPNNINNLQILCRSCNASKGARQPGALWNVGNRRNGGAI